MDAALIDPLAVDPARLVHDDRLRLLEAIEHQRSALDAQQQLTLSLLADEDDGDDGDASAKEWVREEVAAVLSLAPATAAVKLHEATELIHRLPQVFDRLVDGSITMMHARAVIDASRFLPDRAVAELEKRVIAKAQTQTIGNFRRLVKRVLMAVDPRDAEQQHAAAVADRTVRITPASTAWRRYGRACEPTPRRR